MLWLLVIAWCVAAANAINAMASAAAWAAPYVGWA